MKFGRPATDAEKVALNLRVVKYLIDAERLGVVDARTVGGSKATYYRHRSRAGVS